MASEKRLARRAARQTEFHRVEGRYAKSHDPRTWASKNGGRPLTLADLGYMRQFPRKDYPDMTVDRARRITNMQIARDTGE